MALFDVPKLSGGRERYPFPATDGTEIAVWAHHPTPEELAAAFRDAGVNMSEEGKVSFGSDNQFEAAIKNSAAYVALADLCIEACENLDGWPENPRTKWPDGLERLSKEAFELLPRIVKRQVGEQLFKASRVSEAEGNV